MFELPGTIAEKVLARASGEDDLSPGKIVNASVDRAMSHDTTALVLKQFGQIGAGKIWDPDRVVVVLDHRVPANTVESAHSHTLVRKVVKHQGIKTFYDVGEGIGHILMMEKGHVIPGELIVATDSHTTSYGALGALGTGIGATEMASVWATGELWLKVPPTIKISYRGKLPGNISGKDLILHTLGKLGAEFANYKALEFSGEVTRALPVDDRITICNMSVEMGAKFATVPYDSITEEFFRTNFPQVPDNIDKNILQADPDAEYHDFREFDISGLEPQVACPPSVDDVKPAGDVAGIEFQQALLGTCTNGSLSDLEIASKYLKGNRIHKNVRMYVVPGSRKIYLDALRKGLIEIFIRSGCVILNPGCGPCMGAHLGLLAPGEVALSTSNRNFRGRMGSPEAKIYLASPATVAASALSGTITPPWEVNDR